MRERKRNRVSDRRPSRAAVTLLVLAGYLVGLAAGMAFIIFIPYINGRHSLPDLAAQQTDSVLRTYAASEGPTFGTEFHLYREDGRRIFSIDQFLSPGQRDRLRAYAAETLEKGQIYRLALLRVGERDPGAPCFCIVCGVVREGPTGWHFAGLLLRDLRDLWGSLETFAGIYTLVFLPAALLIVNILRGQRELNRMRRDLVANVSHELKTPITSIRAIAEILHDGLAETPEDVRRHAASILRETDSLQDMVMEILELSRLQSSRVELKKAPVHVDGFFRPLVDRYMMLCGDLGVRFEASDLAGYEGGPQLYTDLENMTKVLSVLLDNAIKFTGKGGTVSLNLIPGKSFLTVSVRDNGPGIRAEDLDHIFDRFYKADTSRNSQGSGLGLAIAHEIARALDEKLWVESTYGQGSEFFCTIHYK